MARPLPISLHLQKLNPTFILAFMAVFSVFSAVIFLCGSHRTTLKSIKGKEEKKTVRLGGKSEKVIKKMQSRLSGKALLMAKRISWRKVTDEGEATDHQVFEYEHEGGDGEDEDAVWRKTIIKGEKCRPLDFSGKILYDTNGNLLQDSSS